MLLRSLYFADNVVSVLCFSLSLSFSALLFMQYRLVVLSPSVSELLKWKRKQNHNKLAKKEKIKANMALIRKKKTIKG